MRDPQDEVEPQARLSPRLAHQPAQIWDWVGRRWTLEVTFAEARAPLGMETQRQWNALAIQRTPPALVGRSSLVPLLAHGLLQAEARVVRPAAWSAKVRPTFSAARAVVRRELWSCGHFAMSESHAEMVKIPRSVLDRLTDTVCYAA